jgi:hypothetical protein
MAHGHDVHFLERLERLSTPQTELALSLYQDPLLIRALLEQIRLPDGAARVALSLADGDRGPFVVVARDGHFVTCLAEGMSPGDHPVIARGQLDAIARRVDEVRNRFDAVQQLAGRHGNVFALLGRIFSAGPGSAGRSSRPSPPSSHSSSGTSCACSGRPTPSSLAPVRSRAVA